MQQVQTVNNSFLYQKAKSQRSKPRKFLEIHNKNSKNQRFLDLREISPKKLLESSIFNKNIVNTNKKCIILKEIQSECKNSQNEFILKLQNKKPNSHNANRKQSENFTSKRNLAEQNYLTIFTDRNIHKQQNSSSKSNVSTKANSQFSLKQNISLDYQNDQKRIIKLKTCQSEIQLQKNQIKKQISIQDFDILNFCGEGVFGCVFIARHIKTNGIYALKKILKAGLNHQKDKQSLIREIKIHLQLNHPNIVKFYGCFSSDKAIYYMLQLCQSGNLYELLQKNGVFQEKQVRQIIRQICSALEYLHAKNIIHRDIKAQNIVVHEKVVKICDFGWASQGQYSRKSLCGTPAYLSPQIIQNKLYDKKVDIWSMGVLTFELLFGRIPFDIKTQLDFKKVVQDELMFPKEIQISKNCKDFLLKCLEKDSFKRWDASSLLNHPFLKRQ